MGLSVIVVIIVVLGLVAWVIGVYNFFQTTKARIKASIQEIGNQLKRQSSLIPNLESSAKGYLKHEKDIFKSLTDARKAVDTAANSGDMSQIDKAAQQIQSLLPKLQIMVEDNPELKSDKVVTQLMDELRDTADKLMYARRTVIDLAADYNIKRVTFPSNLVANMFSFSEEKGLETPLSGDHISVSQQETQDVKVNL